MKFEVLKRSYLKRNIIIGIIIVGIISAIILNFTRAKYKVTESIPLVNGIINYSLADLNIVAIYQENENGEYESINEVPTSGYVLNEEESYCEINNIKQDNIIINYNTSTKSLSISPMTTKGTKCYLYFEQSKLFYNQLLADNPTRLTRTDFSTPLETENTGTLYTVGSPWIEEFEGSLDTVYYFAGNALNNWVKFGQDSTGADLYWRIIRTNEDGSIRLLYSGNNVNSNDAYISTDYYYASSSNPDFLGYMLVYENDKFLYDSVAKTAIDTWYSNTLNIKLDINGIKYDKYISKDAVYCNDKSYKITNMYIYGTRNRIQDNKRPSYKCGIDYNGNLYDNANILDKFSVSNNSGGNSNLKYPIALITADEIAFAGGVYDISSNAWFNNNALKENIIGNNFWWTMSPAHCSSGGTFCRVYSIENKKISTLQSGTPAIRPVISLKSCVEWSSGNGSPDNPYEVSIDSNCASVEN